MDPRSHALAHVHEPLFALRPIIAAAESAGVSIAEALSEAQLGDLAEQPPERRVPGPIALRVWAAVEARLPPGFPIQVAAAIEPGRTLSPLAMYSAVAPTLGESARRLVATSAAGSQLVGWHLERAGEVEWLVAELACDGAPGQAACAEYMVADLVTVARWYTHDALAADVHFTHAPRASLREYDRFFRGVVAFDQPRTAIRMSRELRATPCVRADPVLSEYFGERVAAVLDSLADAAVTTVVEGFVRGTLSSGPPSLDAAARHVGASPSTLQRRLRAEGTSYRRLVDNTRRALALDLLARPDLRVSDVAYEAGFSDARAFTRAFRRWTGEAPLSWRRGAR